MDADLTPAQEATMAILQDLVGLSGFRWKGQEDGVARVTLLPVDIGQRLHVVPYDVLVDRVGAATVAE